ncbi:hypothetical protein GCM10020218_069800 [Dactylosporangium vinaceum]
MVAVAAAPDWVTVAFHAWVTVWPPGNVHVNRQPFTGSPRLVTSTFAPKPPGHWLVIVYVARHPAVAAEAVWAAATPAPASARVAAAIAPILFFCMRLLTSQEDGPANGSAAGPSWRFRYRRSR